MIKPNRLGKTNRIISVRWAAIVLAFLTVIGALLIGSKAYADEESETIDIIFTHDIHSYLESYDVIEDGKMLNVGGMARLSSLIKEKREANKDVLLLDAGDYPMGTLYQTLYESDALEYRMLSKLGYDAITFGNHDFDYGNAAMVSHFNSAKEKCDYYPSFVICNIDWTVNDDPTRNLYEAMKDIGLCEYTVLERNGIKIGITGVLGYDALKCAPTCELTVLDPVESVRATVDKMIKEENPDMIICISHSGTSEKSEKSEDELLAKAVPEIDVIISGHTHTALEEPIIVGKTVICSCGCYGRNTGFVSLKKSADGRYELVDYELIGMTDDIEEDPEIKELLDEFKDKIDEEYLSEYGFYADQVVANSELTFDTVDAVYDEHEEHNLGSIIADAYRWAVSNTNTGDDNEVSVAVAPAGTIRAYYVEGPITVAKVYESFSLGSGADGSVGYPLIDVYLTGEELMTACEIDASVSSIMKTARLYFSGLEFTFNNHRIILNKVEECHLNTEITKDDADIPIEKDKLYRVVTDLYSGRMLGAVTDISHGLLSVVPKNKDGIPYEDIEDAIIYDLDTGKEVKAWVSIARYMQTFDIDGDNIGDGLGYYVNDHERKIVHDSWNPIDLVKNPNKFFFIIIGIVILLIVVLILIIKLLVYLVLKIKSKFNSSKNVH